MPDFIPHQRITPFLFELPHTCHQWLKLFLALGVAESPNAAHFARTLQLLEQAQLDAGNPNVAEAMMLAQQGLVRSLVEPEEAEAWERVPLLGEDGQLHPSSSLLLRDQELGQELQLSEQLWSHPDEDLSTLKAFLGLLPPHLRPALLSEVVTSAVDYTASVPCSDADCGVESGLSGLLSSEEFADQLGRLFRQERQADSVWREAVDGLRKTEVLCFERLATHLVHVRTGAEVGEGEEAAVAHYSGVSHSLAVSHESAAESGSRAQFVASLAAALHSALPLTSFQAAMHLQQLLYVETSSEASPRVALPAEMEAVRAVSGPRVGDRLSSSLLHDLLLSCLHFYDPGELVGYLLPSASSNSFPLALPNCSNSRYDYFETRKR